jgi:hypothetical protein
VAERQTGGRLRDRQESGCERQADSLELPDIQAGGRKTYKRLEGWHSDGI